MRRLLKYIPNFHVAKEIRNLIEGESNVIIVSPDQKISQEFFDLFSETRFPIFRVALLTEDQKYGSWAKGALNVSFFHSRSDVPQADQMKSLFRVDVDEIRIRNPLEDSSLKNIFAALETGHFFMGISNSTCSEQTLSNWLNINSDFNEGVWDRMLEKLYFFEIGPSKNGTPILKNINKHTYNNKKISTDRLLELYQFPVIKNRDLILSRGNESYIMSKVFEHKTVPFIKQERPFNQVTTSDQISTWTSNFTNKQQKFTKDQKAFIKPAFVPITRELSYSEQESLNNWLESSGDIFTDENQAHLMMQIETRILPEHLQAIFEPDKVLRFFYNLDQKVQLDWDEYENPFGKSFSVKVLTKDSALSKFPSNLPTSLMRERYAILDLKEIPDMPLFINQEDEELPCFFANKFEGHPYSVREYDIPRCPECSKSMKLFFQADSWGGEFILYMGANHKGHFFYCPDHTTEWALIQGKT